MEPHKHANLTFCYSRTLLRNEEHTKSICKWTFKISSHFFCWTIYFWKDKDTFFIFATNGNNDYHQFRKIRSHLLPIDTSPDPFMGEAGLSIPLCIPWYSEYWMCFITNLQDVLRKGVSFMSWLVTRFGRTECLCRNFSLNLVTITQGDVVRIWDYIFMLWGSILGGITR